MELNEKIVKDVLGLEGKPSVSIMSQFYKLVQNHPVNSIWLKDDKPYYSRIGNIVEETEDLVVVA